MRGFTAVPVIPGDKMTSARRNDYDVTNTVQVSSTNAVHEAVDALVRATWPDAPHGELASAFEHFEEVFAGRFPGYFGVDTVYHDRQHTLDITLALIRMLVGYERQVAPELRMGGERAVVGLIIALFHDVGYLRRVGEDEASRNGAEFTRTHVSRGARFLNEYLPNTTLAEWTEKACEIVHYTGYEVPIAKIDVSDPRDIKLGHMIGTADMIAQMSDRCYLEKCRDRLYAEFVLGGVALPVANNGGERQVKYASGLDLLRQTPGVRRRGAHQAPRWRVRRRLPLSGNPLRRREPLRRGHRPQRRVSAAGPAQRELAPAAPEPAHLRCHPRPDDDHARADARVHQEGLE